MFSRNLIALLTVPAVLLGCAAESQHAEDLGASQSPLVKLNGESCVTLLAGQSQIAGTVCTDIDGDNFVVNYTASNGWLLYDTHLWAGLNLASMPQTSSGNPKVGNFPYKSGSLAGLSSYQFQVPLSVFGLSASLTSCAPVNAYLVAHAVVKKSLPDGTVRAETAYGEGTRLVQKGNWATWFSTTLTCEDEDPKVARCETAFAYGDALSTCFIDSELLTTQRWGWFTGPVGPGSYSFEIYAGAGQCDLAKGTAVGLLSVSYDGSEAKISYKTSPGFTLDETHLYVGSQPLPADRNGDYTVAPGQFGNSHELSGASSDSFQIAGLSGDIYVVAHAVACSSSWPQ